MVKTVDKKNGEGFARIGGSHFDRANYFLVKYSK